MYSITYECDNCGCSTSKSYKKGVAAPQTVDCSNCGCKAQKTVGYPKSPEPYKIPYTPPEKDIYPPWVDPWKPYKKGPYDDWFPQNPKITWGTRPDVVKPSTTIDLIDYVFPKRKDEFLYRIIINTCSK